VPADAELLVRFLHLEYFFWGINDCESCLLISG
jgi:hypothetical protein